VKVSGGWLARYAAFVTSADTGAVLRSDITASAKTHPKKAGRK
jgi:hypothetical protein